MLWVDIYRVAQEQEWTKVETHKKVKKIKTESHEAHEILYLPHTAQSTEEELRVQLGGGEVPTDKIVPLTREIEKLCEKLDLSLYDWGTGALAVQNSNIEI